MGFSSWVTSDTQESIANKFYDKEKVMAIKMLDHRGNEWVEYAYEGYASVGGKCYWDLLKEMNPLGAKNKRPGHRKDKIKKPKIVTINCNKKWKSLPDTKWCDYQGYFYEGIKI